MQRRKRGSIHSIQRKVLSVLGAQAILLSATLSWAEGTPNHVKDVKVRTTDAASGATEIEVVGTTAPVFNVRVEGGGRRLVVDIANADVAGAKEAITQAVGVVGGVMTQTFKTDAGHHPRRGR
jgi:type IV pilus assembly protein PilQ